MIKNNTCCFIGHRKIEVTDGIKNQLRRTIINLISEQSVNTFLFGSKSEFNDLCYEIVSELKNEYKYLKRIYVRAEFPYINDSYKNYLSERYEATYFPEKIANAGKASYIERNYDMIDNSNFCIMYYNENYTLPDKTNKSGFIIRESKSGTKIAYDYALKKNIKLINIFSNNVSF